MSGSARPDVGVAPSELTASSSTGSTPRLPLQTCLHLARRLVIVMTDWWRVVVVHELGIEIAADQKAGGGRYRLLAKLPCLNCEREARRTRTILAQYAGQGGKKWLWTPGYKGLVNRPGPTSQ